METNLRDAIDANETAGLSRDEALAKAIADVSTDLGLTEQALLDQIGSTEQDLLAALAESEATISDEIDAVSDLIGKDATEVTQVDIDFVADLIAQTEVANELDEATRVKYDVNNDGLVDALDQTMLEALLIGEDVTIADTSPFANTDPTGIYETISDTETVLQEQIDQTQEQVIESEQNIRTNIENEADKNKFLQLLLDAEDAGGQQVSVKGADPLQLGYLYDFNSIFATPNQENMFLSPYAEGGKVESTTDKLLKLIGGR